MCYNGFTKAKQIRHLLTKTNLQEFNLPTVLQVRPKAPTTSSRKSGDFKVSATGKNIQTLNIGISSLVPFPVKMYSPYNAPESSGLRLACPHCKDFIGQPRQCLNDECEHKGILAEHDSPVKVFREGDTVIVLNDEDMEYLDLPTKDNFVVSAVVPFKDVEDLTFYADGLYYTAPASAHAARLYSGVVAYLKKTKKCIIGKYTLRTGREILGMIRVFGGCLVIQNIPFAAARRPLPEWEAPTVSENDYDTIGRVFEELPQSFMYQEIRDEYGASLQKLVQDAYAIALAPAKKASRTKKKYIPDAPSQDRETIEDLFASLEGGSGGKIAFVRGGK